MPTGVFILTTYILAPLIKMAPLSGFYLKVLSATLLPLVGAVILAASGAGLSWALILIMLSPWLTVIAFEVVGTGRL
ncbi:MAG: hypothetical protein R3E89_05425 [Thiolinea sp.]